jgi:hypothetical protein
VFGNKTSGKIFVPIRGVLTEKTYTTTRLLKLFSSRQKEKGLNVRHGEKMGR